MNRREVLAGAVAVGATAVVGRRACALMQHGDEDKFDARALTNSGLVSGIKTHVGGTDSIYSFKGIPYGMDTAKTRFAAPKKPVSWTGVRVCTEWGPRAPQTVGARPEYESAKVHDAAPEHGYHLPPDEGVQSEDCLHVNV